MTCPSCAAAELSSATGVCGLCGFASKGAAAVAVETRADTIAQRARKELSHDFEFGEMLGRRKHSAVYRARERSSGRSVLLKLVPRNAAEPDAEENFRTMLGAVVTFDHPQLVPVLRFGSTDSVFWYAMADLGLTPLRATLRANGPMDPRACRRIITQVVTALDYLHRHGVIHGAIKPDNVMLDKDGWVRICDPAFKRSRWRRPTKSTSGNGTPSQGTPGRTPRPAWVAPEDHERGERLPAADQYAVAALAFECVSGHPPADPPEPLLSARPDAVPEMARAIDRALSDDPWQRFPSCADFLWALEGAPSTPAHHPTGSLSQDVVMIKEWKPPADARQPLFLIVRVVAVLLIVGALGVAAPTILRIIRPQERAQSQTTAPTRSGVPSSAALAEAAAAARRNSAAAIVPGTTRAPSSIPYAARPTTPAPRPANSMPPAGASIDRQAAAVTTPSTPAAPPARLFVNASPWGQLYVDGTLIGNTPKANIELSPGEHVVRITRPGFIPFERSLTVQSGDTLRLTDIVLVPGQP